MSANIWAPGSETINIDAQQTNVLQAFVSTAGQTIFDLTAFTYNPAAGSIAVYRNGQRLESGIDFAESSSTRITILLDLAAGERITAYGLIGSASENALAAAASAEAAAISEAAAAASAASLASSVLPSQTGQAGQFLTTDGTNLDWATVDALPSQAGQNGKVLTTDGLVASWTEQQANKTAFGLYENATVIAADYVITAGNNAISAGPITVNSGVTVTVPSGSTWSIV